MALPRLTGGLDAGTPIDVTVRADSIERRMEESSQAVQVLDLKQSRVESADLGSVLARVPGVSVRRMAGLGSETRFSINAMQGDQVRFFLDGIPLDYMGYSFGIANIPVNLISRVEIYSGVVPIRFGADALGGAVNLVSDEQVGKTRAGMSFQYGSFATQRATAMAQYARADRGLFARIEAFRDAADNDYRVDVPITDVTGRESVRNVRRFHDGYWAHGLAAEAGVVRRPWASRLSLRAFMTGHHKELQTDRLMQFPYGEAETRASREGLLLRYNAPNRGRWSITTQTGYSRLSTRFTDLAACVYDWYGKCGRARRAFGEVGSYDSGNGSDQQADQGHAFHRSLWSWRAREWLSLSLSTAPTFVHQMGEDVRITNPEVRDPLEVKRRLFTLINGAEGRVDLLDDKLELLSFAKQYYQYVKTVEGADASLRDVSRGSNRVGAGAQVRYRLTEWWLAKASYEWATRLPEASEILGDNGTIKPNAQLGPERSHNYNLGSTLRFEQTVAGSWSLTLSGFVRQVEDLILLMPDDARFSRYMNVYETNARGGIADARWSSPHEYVLLAGNVTSQSYVAAASDGPFGYLKGKRLPNRPSLFANAELRVQFRDVLRANDQVFVSHYLNWVEEFYRGWEGVGATQYKQVVPSQLTLHLVLGYVLRRSLGNFSASVEAQNLTDAKVYDFYGAQKPGRAFYAKLTGELN